MFTLRFVQLTFWVGVVLGGIKPAFADPVVFASRAAFDAAFRDAVVENWDRFPAGHVFPNGSTTAGITYMSSVGVAIVHDIFAPTTPPNSLGRTDQNFFDPNDSMTFRFSSALMAFGIDINTFAMLDDTYRITTSRGEVIGSFFDPFPGMTTGQFVGFSTTSPFRSVTISVTGVNAGYTLDTLRSVPVVPEPSSLLLLGTGAAGPLVTWWRRARACRPRRQR